MTKNNTFFRKTIFAVALIVASVSAWGQTVETLAATGTGTWICPPGVTSITVECWGGGGAGGAAKNTTAANSARGGGGAGGGYSKATFPVTAGTEYNYSVGAGGIGVVLTADFEVAPSGGNTYFIDLTTVNAPGGNGGISRLCGSTQTYASGVTYAPTTTAAGDVKYNGGNGGASASAGSGNGGSSGGTGSDGTLNATAKAQSTVTGGGTGAAGKSGAGNGNSGGIPGGAGAGAKADANQDYKGGNGGNGQIILTYSGAITGDYTWDGSTSNDWKVADNWTPVRTIPVAGDILRFNTGGSVTVTNIPASQTLGQLIISGNTALELQATTNTTLTISGASGTDLDLAAGSSLTLSGTTSSIRLALATGTTGTIAGNVTFSGTDAATGLNHQITAIDAAAITFANGSVMTAGVNFKGYPFGTAPNGAVVFQSGSTYLHSSGDTPFGGATTTNVSIFETGSLYKFTGIVGGVAPAAVIAKPAFSGKTYSNFEIASPAAGITSSALSADVTFANMVINGTTFAISLNTNSAKTNIKGNVTIGTNGGITFGNAAEVSPVTFNGTTAQTITLTDNGIFANGTGAVVTIDNPVTLNGNITNAGTLNVSATKALIVASGKTLTNTGTLNNAGVMLNLGTLTGTTTGAGFIVNAAANDNAMGSVTGSVTGADVSLTANPASGYSFVNWTEAPTGAIGTDAMLPAFTASANRTIVANFSVSTTDINNAMAPVFATVENRKVLIKGEVNALEIFNAQGKLVYTKKQTVNSVSIPTSGIYIVKMHTPAGTKIQKLSVM